MFKCTECGAVHNTKPDYCDCGNDSFIEILPSPSSAPKSVREPHRNTSYTPQVFDRIKRSVDPLSLSIFTLCIILSIIPWVILMKNPPQKPDKSATSVQTTKVKKQMPDINKIWNDAPAQSVVPEPVVPQTPVQKITQIIKPKPKTQTQQAKPKTQQAQKPVQKVEKPKPAPVKTQSAKPVNTHNDVVKRVQDNLSNKPVEEKPKTPVVAEKPVVKQDAPKVETPKYTAAELSELNYYKNTLRMTLLSKLNVQSIIGEGSCDIEFSIAPNGKLLNRKFSKQSSNKSLNDAIYYMLMSVPVYKVPPTAYDGETIRLHFYINNGYYEISFK